MGSVLMLFLIPVGGGIPAGVLLAQAKGLGWPVTAGLYLVSDLILALAYEPVLKLLVLLAGRSLFLTRFGAAMKLSMARLVAPFHGAGPVMLVLIAFGVDPVTGRTTALAMGHGPVAGWSFAITGDMLYYAVIAVTTLRLNAYIKNPTMTALIVFGAMMAVPMLVSRWRNRARP